MAKIRQATLADHDEIVKLARTSKYTGDFSNHMFSPPSAYEKGWIRVAIHMMGHREKIIGFYCVRHKVRADETSLYFITVHPGYAKLGHGTALLMDLKEQCPHPKIVLNVMKSNTDVIRWYRNHGFKEGGDALKGEGTQMSLTWSRE